MTNKDDLSTSNRNVMEGETCPACLKKTLTLMEEEMEIPYFGKVFVFGMDCNNCNYHKGDIEAAEKKKTVKGNN